MDDTENIPLNISSNLESVSKDEERIKTLPAPKDEEIAKEVELQNKMEAVFSGKKRPAFEDYNSPTKFSNDNKRRKMNEETENKLANLFKEK